MKLKGYNPIFVLLLPEDKLLYKKNIYQSIEKYMNQNSQSIEKVKKKYDISQKYLLIYYYVVSTVDCIV